MKNDFLNNCQAVIDSVYEAENQNSLSFLTKLSITFHLMLCPQCAKELKHLKHLEEIMKTDFFPLSPPDFENTVMERIFEETFMNKEIVVQAGFSFRGWILIGFFMLISLSSSFFGVNFTEIANTEGLSFLLPVGLTIGMAVTCYGALFVASHLKELSARFRLH